MKGNDHSSYFNNGDANQPADTAKVGKKIIWHSPPVLATMGLLILLGLSGTFYLKPIQYQPSPQTQHTSIPTKAQTLIPTGPKPTEIPLSTSTPYPTYQPDPSIAARIPADWTFVKSAACNVAFPLPPKKQPYYYPFDPKAYQQIGDMASGRFWQFWEFQHGGGEWDARAIFLAEREGGTEGGNTVIVNCWPNAASYTTKTWFIKRLSELQNDASYLSNMKPGEEEYIWERNVSTAGFEGKNYPQFYFFATKTHTYQIIKDSISKTLFVRETTEKVFSNLFFLN